MEFINKWFENSYFSNKAGLNILKINNNKSYAGDKVYPIAQALIWWRCRSSAGDVGDLLGGWLEGGVIRDKIEKVLIRKKSRKKSHEKTFSITDQGYCLKRTKEK